MGSDDGSSNMFMNPCADGDFIVRALHEYHTDSPGHLSFSQFQYIKVRHCEESGWWLGESENKRGWFPSNRVEKVDPVYETEITSEDYDQIRTGLDGVETQFLGEPVTDSVSDSMQLDWGARSPPMGGIGAGTGVWTRAGQLAFPPSQLSIIPQSSYYASESTANMGSDSYYQQTQMSSTTTVTGEETGAGTNGIDNEDLSYAYSDFVTEVGLYVRELREAASRGEIDRYQPIVASIFACVKALLIFTNTIARESEVLQMYPELARSRQFILRALGKLYSKCRVANGSQARTTSRQRQFAVEKLGIFGGQVLGGITEFTTRAHEIGLRLRAESAAEAATGGGVGAGAKELDMVLTTSGSITSSSPVTSSPSYQRLRRRVSRANSAKGYKSFNAVRQWRAENIQKYNTARKSVELLLAEYMECLNNGNGATELDRVLRTTIQAAQAVELFLVSAEEMRARTNAKEDNEYAAHKAELSSTLMELFDYIRVLEIASGTMSSSNETVMNRFLSLASVVLRCLAEMDVHPKANLASSLESSESSTRSSFSEEHEPEVPKLPSATPAMVPIPAAPINNSMCGEESLPSGQANSNNDTQPKYASPRNTASPRQKHLINVVTPVMPLKKKFGSLTSLNERYKRQAVGQQSSDKDGSHLNPEAAYGEGNDMDRNHPDLYRSSHDTAVVITSARNTSHRGLKNADEGTPSLGPAVVEAESQLKETTEPTRPQERQPKPKTKTGNANVILKGAERKVATVFVPTMEMSQLVEVATSMPLSINQTFQQDAGRTSTPSLRPQQIVEPTRQPSPSARAARTRNTAADSATSSRLPGNRIRAVSRNNRSNSQGDTKRVLTDDPNIIGLGVSIPVESLAKSSSSSPTLSGLSRPVSRQSGVARTRSPVAASPKLDPSRRKPKPETPPLPNSPSLGPESRTISRNSNTSNTNLSPTIAARSSRRGSQASIRSDISGKRRSNDSQLSKEKHSSRQDYQERRPPATSSSQAGGPRRISNAGTNNTRTEPQPTGNNDGDVLSGLSTPTTPHIQSFVDNGPSPRRPDKSHRRESAMSTLSVGPDSSMHSRTSGALRPVSPALRGRNSLQDISGARGRASSESIVASDRQQHHQQQAATRNSPLSTGYRPRQNKVGQDKVRISSEIKSDTSTSQTTMWYLENDYEEDEVLYNDNGTLVAATLEAYIEMLTSHKNVPDPVFVTTFFTTFRLFTTPLDLIHHLNRRFIQPPPPELEDHEHSAWQQQKQERIQKRVHIALKTWVEGYWVSEKDRDAFKPIMDFVAHDLMKALPAPAGRLLDMLNQWANKRKSLLLNARSPTMGKARSHERLSQHGQEQQSSSTAPGSNSNGNSSSNSGNSSGSIIGNKLYATVKEKSSTDQLRSIGRRGIGGFSRESLQIRGPPVPQVTKALLTALSSDSTMAKVPVADIKPVELARQLTIMVGKLFSAIPYLELLSKERPNCSRMIQVSNKITIWVTDTIVDEKDVKKRIGVVKHWIEIGEECLKLNNFDTLTAISCAIESTPVRRLHNTWEGVSKSYVERSLQLKKVISSEMNYSVYRTKLKTVQAPCIPFLGLYFTVIAYIEDGNSVYKDINPPGAAAAAAAVATAVATAETATAAAEVVAVAEVAAVATVAAAAGSSDSTTSSAQMSQHAPPNTPTPVSTRKLLRYGRFSQLAKAVQEFRDFQGVYDLLEVPRLADYILKCMENLDSERSYRKSLAIEPRRTTPSNIPGGIHAGWINGSGGGQRPSGGIIGLGGAGHRASSNSRGLFYGGTSNPEVNGSSMPAKLNKFFRKSTRNDRS
ncbi:hypothetical protein BGZ58_005703 [Dissophora ornata]|nr:hypothetical protein BGZ58_005703 [Dissophora ornata]